MGRLEGLPFFCAIEGGLPCGAGILIAKEKINKVLT